MPCADGDGSEPGGLVDQNGAARAVVGAGHAVRIEALLIRFPLGDPAPAVERAIILYGTGPYGSRLETAKGVIAEYRRHRDLIVRVAGGIRTDAQRAVRIAAPAEGAALGVKGAAMPHAEGHRLPVGAIPPSRYVEYKVIRKIANR